MLLRLFIPMIICCKCIPIPFRYLHSTMKEDKVADCECICDCYCCELCHSCFGHYFVPCWNTCAELFMLMCYDLKTIMCFFSDVNCYSDNDKFMCTYNNSIDRSDGTRRKHGTFPHRQQCKCYDKILPMAIDFKINYSETITSQPAFTSQLSTYSPVETSACASCI